MIDFIRGVAIIDMMLVHYSDFFNSVPGIVAIAKFIRYTDFAIEGFILLAGFVVGYHYFGSFTKDKSNVVRRLLKRILEIIKIYYLMVFTISLPLAILFGERVTKSDTVVSYLLKSLLFLNQVPLLHILPTFIPLLLLAIPVLYLLEKKRDDLVLMISLLLFIVGNFNPYLLNLGEKAIFPAILWQIYFVMGIMLGKRLHLNGGRLLENVSSHALWAATILGIMLFVNFGRHFLHEWGEFQMAHGFVVNKFPLNFLGLFYYGSIFYAVCCLTVILWKYIQKWNLLFNAVAIFGRHSLLTFVIHVYFCVVAIYFSYGSVPVVSLIIGLNIVVTLTVLNYLEAKQLAIAYIKPRAT